MASHSLNRSMMQLTGYEDEDVAGKPFVDTFSAPEDATLVAATIAAAAAGEDPGEQETYWTTRDGRQVLVAWTCTPLPAREAARRLVISGVDVTERRLREEEQAALRRVAVAVAAESRPRTSSRPSPRRSAGCSAQTSQAWCGSSRTRTRA